MTTITVQHLARAQNLIDVMSAQAEARSEQPGANPTLDRVRSQDHRLRFLAQGLGSVAVAVEDLAAAESGYHGPDPHAFARIREWRRRLLEDVARIAADAQRWIAVEVADHPEVLK